jgi:small subunit ribosomal protein S5
MNKENEEQPKDIDKAQGPEVSLPEKSPDTQGEPEINDEVQDEQSDGHNGDVREEHRNAQKGKKINYAGKGSGKKGAPQRQEPEDTGIIEKVVAINRITKVTKGGKKMSFSALVVVGDTKGNVGYSLSKAAEVATAIRKAMATAKKNMVRIPMRGTTIPHEIIGQCGGSRVLLKPASDGTGVIASGPVRAVCDGAGIHNILTKCHRSNNPINVVKATLNGLTRLKSMIEKVEIKPTDDKVKIPIDEIAEVKE